MPVAPTDPADRHQLIINTELMRLVTEWRGKQPDVPNKSEAIRRLLTIALKIEGFMD